MQPQNPTGSSIQDGRFFGVFENNLSRLKTCLETANNFLLSEEDAREIFGNLTVAIEQHGEAVCEKAGLK